MVKFPELGLVQDWETWVHIAEVLADEFVQVWTCWQSEGGLELKVLDVFLRKLRKSVNVDEGVG
jgi:hypothetical protein